MVVRSIVKTLIDEGRERKTIEIDHEKGKGMEIENESPLTIDVGFFHD